MGRKWNESKERRRYIEYASMHTADGSFCHLKSTNKIKMIFENRQYTVFHPR